MNARRKRRRSPANSGSDFVKAGDLTHRVTFWSRTNARDANGGQVPGWAALATVWAAIEPARVLRSFGGAQEQENYDTLIRIRYLASVRSSMKATWEVPDAGSPPETKTYQVIGVRTKDERRGEMFVHCIERQGDGFWT